MQNKGFIRTIAILFAIACIYQLSFSFVTYKVRKDAAKYAEVDKNQLNNFISNNRLESLNDSDKQRLADSISNRLETRYLDSISSEVVYNLGVFDYTYRECQQRELNLGLDLKGGMNVILEVSVVDIIKSMASNPNDETFVKAINLAQEKQKNSQESFVNLFGEAFEEIDPNGRLAAIFSTPELREQINFNSTNEEVLDVLRTESKSAIDNSFQILRSRIDRFGVVQPNIQRLETSGRILVELPGVKDQERVRKLLQGTANLEFWETYENQEIYPYLIEANTVIKDIQDLEKEENETDDVAETITGDEQGENIATADLVGDEDQEEEAPSLLEEIESDTTAADTAMSPEMGEYPLFQVLMPNYFNNQLGRGSIIGFAHFKDTAQVNDYLSMAKVRSLFPHDFRYYWSIKPSQALQGDNHYELHAIKVTGRDGKAPLDGDAISDARVSLSQFTNEVTVSMSMNADGAKTWARLTKDAAAQDPKRSIAIVLDDYVYSSPRVNEEISGGSSQISGNFTDIEARDLANVLKSGKLPAPARIIEEEIVGPSLGQESINAGLNSFAIAFVVVLLYMLFYYSRRAGGVADIALIANMFFLVGVLASLGAVLTLPGIAGIVLTIGMSVDANVLIYERIREEIKSGKGAKLAISDGYKNAYSAILDANITTLLTAIILFAFGTGPIKGFATTLMYGIFTSLFSAIFITRLIFEWYLNKGWNVSFATKLTNNAFKDTKIKFLEKRKIFYVISSLIIIGGIASLAVRGLNPGIDFTGGRTYIVRFEEPVNTLDIQSNLMDQFGTMPQVVTYGGENQVKIVTKYKIDETDIAVDTEVEQLLFEGLQEFLPDNITKAEFLDTYRQSSLKVGPSIADDIKVQAMWAIGLSLLIVFLYILIRFKNWQFGLGAVAALFHDTLIVLGLFSILYGVLPFSLEINQAFIAAILTVVGYSINDTVVVFDRIREYVGLYRKRERKEILNTALNSTLSRTFSTSLSTFVVLLTIFIFGGEVIRGFIFALLIGVVVGTYSSLFIATPIVYDTIKGSETDRILKSKKRS